MQPHPGMGTMQPHPSMAPGMASPMMSHPGAMADPYGKVSVNETEANAASKLLEAAKGKKGNADLPIMTKQTVSHDIEQAAVPFALFLGTAVVFTFMYHRSSGFLLGFLNLAVILFAWSALAPTLKARFPAVQERASWPGLSIRSWGARQFALSAAALLVGAMAGYFNYCTGIRDYYAFWEHNQYTNVWPDEPAAAHADASAIVFAVGTSPDSARAAGFIAGRHVYCAAPVRMVASQGSPVIQYWAVGKDCCTNQPPTFTCGDAASGARSGITLYNRSNIFDFAVSRDTDFYHTALRQAAALNGLATADVPLLLEWSADVDASNWRRVVNALLFLLFISFLAFPVFVILSMNPNKFNAIMTTTKQRLRTQQDVDDFKAKAGYGAVQEPAGGGGGGH